MLLIVKNVVSTRFAQDADVFEKFKFVGDILEVAGAEVSKTAKELLEAFLKGGPSPDPSKEIVGIILPNKSAAFLKDHKVLSDGEVWTPVDEICEALKAPLEYI